MSKIYTQNNSNFKQNQTLNSDIKADLHSDFMDSKIVYPKNTVIVQNPNISRRATPLPRLVGAGGPWLVQRLCDGFIKSRRTDIKSIRVSTKFWRNVRLAEREKMRFTERGGVFACV